MSGESLIPVDAPGEHDDVADLLSIARVTWNRGDHAAAVSFVQRAAQTAMELELEMRGIELAKVAAELKATLSIVPGPPIPHASSTLTPPLVLTPRAPDAAPASAEPETVRRDDDAVATVPRPRDTNPGLGLLGAEDEVDVDAIKEVTPIASGSPKPPRVGPSVAPRPQTSGSPPRITNTPPPLPVRATSGSPPARRPSIPPNGSPIPPKVASSPVPPKVAPTTSARPATSMGPTPSRGPLPLRVQANVPANVTPSPPVARPAPSPAPPQVAGAIIPPAVEPQNVRKSAPWVDEVVGPIASGGGQPVVVGLKARVHFRTDGSLEIGPDIEAAGGLPVVVLPQRGEDMVTLLKRLKR